LRIHFDVGNVEGHCDVYYEPPEYEGIHLFQNEYIEFTSVEINGKILALNKINDVLYDIMLDSFYKTKESIYV
jgi:hypothetical protein